MSGSLQPVGGDGPPRCSSCGAEAAGPCRRCRRMLCGDCCVLTEGGAQVYALCRGCARGGGAQLGSRWAGVGVTLALVLLGLIGLNLLVSLVAGRW